MGDRKTGQDEPVFRVLRPLRAPLTSHFCNFPGPVLRVNFDYVWDGCAAVQLRGIAVGVFASRGEVVALTLIAGLVSVNQRRRVFTDGGQKHSDLPMITGTSNRQPRELKVLDKMARALAGTRDLSEIKSLRDKAEAARKYAQSAALSLKVQNRAAELKLLAERRAGELLNELVAHGGNRRSRSHHDILKLSDLGINLSQSSRWRREAAVPEAVFERYISAANKLGQDITAQGLLRLERMLASNRKKEQPREAAVRDRNGAVGGSCTALPPRGPSLSAHGNGEDSAHELYGEMKNHRRLLEEILKPFCNSENSTLQRSEKRMVLRLLAEIEHLMSRLEQGKRSLA